MPKLRNPRRAAALAYIALAGVDTYLAGRDGKAARRARYVTKPLLMPTLAARTELAAAGRGGGLVRGVQAAQVFSWGGDVALLGKSQPAFLSGVGSFLVAHLCYIGGFTGAREPGTGIDEPGVKAGAASWAVLAPVMAVAAGRKDPSLRAPIAVYSGVLSAMFASSTVLRRSMPPGARRRIVAGTGLFLLSDSILGAQEFLRREPSPTLESAVMATYTAGQWLIADGATKALGADT